VGWRFVVCAYEFEGVFVEIHLPSHVFEDPQEILDFGVVLCVQEPGDWISES